MISEPLKGQSYKLIAVLKLIAILLVLISCSSSMANEPAKASPSRAGEGADWRTKPITEYASTEGTASYHSIPFDFEDKRSREPLVMLKKGNVASEAFYSRTDGLNAPYYACVCKSDGTTLTREGVAKKLETVNKSLRSYGFELLVLDAYRPVSCQIALWQYFIGRGKELLKDPTDEELTAFAARYCSDPRKFDKNDQKTWPTHSTGGAVDLTIRAIDSKHPAYMGGIFDDASMLSASRFFENKKESDLSASDIEARKNRRILFWAMTEAGFQNYANEWWHYDFGTQLWAKKTNRLNADQNVKAFYGTMPDPRDKSVK